MTERLSRVEQSRAHKQATNKNTFSFLSSLILEDDKAALLR